MTSSHFKSGKCKKELTKESLGIFDEQNASYSQLLENLRQLLRKVTESGMDVVFLIGEFDELDFANTIFYNNLKTTSVVYS